MPNTKISALTAGDPALSTDAIPVARSGANFQLTAASIANLLNRADLITASGTPVVLTVASAPQNFVSGSGGQVIQLPNATTLTVGTAFRFDNNQSSGAITVNNNSGTLVVSVPSGGFVVVTLLTNGTSAGTWDRHDLAPANVSWSTNTFDYPGSITSATWNGVTVATNRGGTGLASFTSGGAVYATSTSALATGTLPTASGGTNLTSFTSGGAVYATSTSALTTGTLPTASGGTNLTSFTSGGAVYATSTSALTTGTLPLASGGTGQTTKAAAFNALSPVTTTGDLILGNGTNSSTRLAIGANSYVLTSNGTTASWQAAGGGGGGVTSFDAGFTGFNPSGTTTGAITLSGTLNTGYGGTGQTVTPGNGVLLIGNGSGYSVNPLTAGTGITITNVSGGITIAASGGGGPTIYQMNISTSSGTFYNNVPTSNYSAPLIGYTAGPSNYGAFFFKNSSSGNYVSSPSINSLSIVPSTGSSSFYVSGTDFSGSANSFYVYDDILACYGFLIFNAGLQTLFSDSSTAITSPSLKPGNASSGFLSGNPAVNVFTSGSTYTNSGGLRGAVVSKSGSIYYLEFGSNDTTFDNSFSISSISININSTPATYSNFSDFTVSFAENTVNGRFSATINAINATLITLLNNSFL
jgi:hypothetical protein